MAAILPVLCALLQYIYAEGRESLSFSFQVSYVDMFSLIVAFALFKVIFVLMLASYDNNMTVYLVFTCLISKLCI